MPTTPGIKPLTPLIGLVMLTSAAFSQEVTVELNCEGEWAASPLCVERAEAFELKARIEAIASDLTNVSNPPWSDVERQDAGTAYEEGLELYNDQFFGDAASKFKVSLERYSEIHSEFQVLADRHRVTAFTHLESEEYEEALALLEVLTQWFPTDEDLANGLSTATKGVELQPSIARIRQLIDDKSFADAESALQAIPPGFFTQEVNAAQQAITSNNRTVLFYAHMSKGYALIDKKKWAAAKDAFEQALEIQPNSVAAQEAYDEASSRGKRQQIDSLHQALIAHEDAELWEEAIVVTQQLANLEPEIRVHQSTVTELQNLIALEDRLNQYAVIVTKPMDGRVRTLIRDLIKTSGEFNHFNRISEKRSQLEEDFERYTTPIQITLVSDRRTDVRIKPGKRLGRFESKDVRILPGSYELIGTRKGFRELRRRIKIEPGQSPERFEVICSVRF